MPDSLIYPDAAQAYADSLRALFRPPAVAVPLVVERGEVPAAPGLADRAAEILARSTDLTNAASPELQAPEVDRRLRASLALLAKAQVDLEVAARLAEAVDQGDEVTSAFTEQVAIASFEEQLSWIVPSAQPISSVVERGLRRVDNPEHGKLLLAQAIDDALGDITKRAGATGQSAVNGLIGLALTEVSGAVSLIGSDVAASLGVGDTIARLAVLARQFAVLALQSLLTLCGGGPASQAGQVVSEYVAKVNLGQLTSNQIKSLQFVPHLVDGAYATNKTLDRLTTVVSSSQGTVRDYQDRIASLDRLVGDYGHQMDWANRILVGAKWLGGVPATIFPHAKIALGAINLLVGAYAILAGADYLDVPQIDLLDRVPGVPRVVDSLG